MLLTNGFDAAELSSALTMFDLMTDFSHNPLDLMTLLCLKGFEAKLEGIIDEVALLPVIQKNLLKIEMLLQNDLLDDHAKALGIAPTEPVVLVMAQSEVNAVAPVIDMIISGMSPTTPASDCRSVDHKFQKIFECGKEFGLHGGTCAFGVDVAPKVDSGVTPTGGPHVVGFYNVPPQVFSEQHVQKHHAFADNISALPAKQKHFRKVERARRLSNRE
ncbi:hypothetical protein B0H13DRAFT_2338940 [Mycena leptocephala]|nr:hypothetical protein B0H13DRAFT_2338940 [Mycena leptocephala]